MFDLELELTPPYASMLLLYEAVEANQQKILAAYASEGWVPSCRSGCDACCHQLVMATMAEAQATADGVRNSPHRTRLEQSLECWLEKTRDLRRKLQNVADDMLESEVETIAAAYWDQRIPCPFLLDRHCAIYEVRPLACRHHFSLSDPSLCAQAEEGIERMETMEEAFFFAQDALPESETEIGMFPELVGLCLHP